MKARTWIGVGAVCFTLGYAVRTPAFRRLREDLEDARSALAAIGPRLLVQAPPAVERELVEVVASAAPSPEELESPPDPILPSPDPASVPAGAPPRFGRERRVRDAAWNDPEAREARRQAFVEHMRERADESRTTFVERTDLDDVQVEKLDSLVFDLNQNAEAIVADWVAYVQETGTWNSDYGIRFAHDLTAVLVAAYDSLDADVAQSWRTAAGDFDLLRMLDPEVLRPMMELQREMGGRGGVFGLFGGRRGFRPPSPPPDGTREVGR